MLLHGRDPYSEEVTRDIQTGFYGRPLNPQNPHDPVDKESFVYPLYVVFLLAPVVSLPFRVVAEIFRWLLLATIAASVPLWMRIFRLDVRWPIVLSGMLLATSTSPAVEEYFQQNLAALVVFFLAAAAAATIARRLTLAGLLLALSTVKPHMTALMVLYFLVWSAAQWKERQRLIWAFSGTLATLMVGAEFLSPHWIGRFAAAVREYSSYGTESSILQVLFSTLLARLITALLFILLLLMWWHWRKSPAASQQFTFALAWTGAVTLVILPKLAAYNALLLMPAIFVLITRYKDVPRGRLFARAMTKAAFACQLWQWAAATLLPIGALLLPVALIRKLAHVPDFTFLALWPITLLALIATTFSLRSQSR